MEKINDDDLISFQTSICPYCFDDHNGTSNCKEAFNNGIQQEQKRIIEILDKRYLEDRKLGRGTGEFWNNLKQQIQEDKNAN